MTTRNALHPKPSSRTFASVDLSTAADGISDPVSLTGLTLSAIQMPASWTDARIGFRATIDGTTDFVHVYDTVGDFLTYATSASRMVAFNPAVFAGFTNIQLVSETSAGVAVAQAAAREIRLGLSEYVIAN